MRLSELKCGERAEIAGFEKGERFYRQKLLSMGLTPGTSFTLARMAPLGDPVEIEVRGYALSLRKEEADILKIKRISLCDL